MKKLLSIICMVSLMMSSSLLFAQNKQQIKEAKKQSKELTKAGWKTEGGAHSIEYYFTQYYMLEGENVLSDGRASDQPSIKVANNAARRDALRKFVELQNTYFEGAGKELEGNLNQEGIDNLVTATRNYFSGNIQGEVIPYFSLYKEKADGKYECIVYCYVNKKKAAQERKEAMQNAIEEAGLAEKF